MKILNLTEFLALPEGVLFNRCEPHVMHDLCIKGRSLGNDFFYTELSDQSHQWVGCESQQFPVDLDAESRDGTFDESMMFAVWEQDEVSSLVAKLETVFPI